jgi:hypothetical protein
MDRNPNFLVETQGNPQSRIDTPRLALRPEHRLALGEAGGASFNKHDVDEFVFAQSVIGAVCSESPVTCISMKMVDRALRLLLQHTDSLALKAPPEPTQHVSRIDLLLNGDAREMAAAAGIIVRAGVEVSRLGTYRERAQDCRITYVCVPAEHAESVAGMLRGCDFAVLGVHEATDY